MASFKHRQASDTNQSVPETDSVPETHSYQEKHFQPTLNEPVAEANQYTEYGSTVKPDPINARSNSVVRSDVTDKSDQPGEEDMLNRERLNRTLQGNSDSGTQYSTPDVGSGVSSGSEGYSQGYTSMGGAGTTAASTASTAAAATTATGTVAAGAASVAVAATGAVVIAVTLVLPMIIGVPSAILFEDIVVTDSSVYYSIYFEDYEEDMELYVSLHNNFTNRTHTVDSEFISVVERDLKPDMEYTITVYGSMSAVLEERTVKTLKSISEPALTVNYLDYMPEKGMFSLSSTLSGDTDDWNDYRAVLYGQDPHGTSGGRFVIASQMLESVDTEQDIMLRIDEDMVYDATFAIECTGPEGTVELYSEPVTVYGSPYFGFTASYDSASEILTIVPTVYDPDGVRSEYYAIMTVTDASSGATYTDSRDLISGGCEFTDVSHGYTFYDIDVRFQCYEGGQFVDIFDRYFTYSSYTSPAFGNVSYDFIHTSGTGTGAGTAYAGLLTVFFDLVDYSDQYTDLRADLGDKAGSGWAQSLNFNNTQRDISFDIDAEGCGTEQPLTIWNGGDKLYEGTVSLVCGDSRFTVSSIETAENSTEMPAQTEVNVANFDLYADYYDADRIYSDFRYTVVQGSKVAEDIPFMPNTDGATRLSFNSSGFVNGPAELYMTYNENGLPVKLPVKDVNVYVGPTATVGTYAYDESTSILTVPITITDQFNAWDNLKAHLERQEPTASGTQYVDSTESFFHNTQASVTFEILTTADENMFNAPLLFSLWMLGDSEIKVFESADTITLPFSKFVSYSADTRDPSSGRGLDFSFDVSDPMDQWSDYNVTVTQGTTQLYSGAVAPGNNELKFGDVQFTNDWASIVLTCTTPSGTKTLTENSVRVYFGPNLSNEDPEFTGTTASGSIYIPVTVTDNDFGIQGRLRLYYETQSGLNVLYSNEDATTGTRGYTFTTTGADFLNRTLSLDMVDGTNAHCSSDTLTVTVPYAYISLENTPQPTDPYGASGRGIRVTVYGGGLDTVQIKATVEQDTTALCSNYDVLTGMETVIPFDNVTFANGTATLSFSDENRNPIPFADGTTEMTVDVYYQPAITNATDGDYAGTGTVTSAITVNDTFGNFAGKYAQLSYTDPADGQTYSVRSTAAFDGQGTAFNATFTLPDDGDIVFFLNTGLNVAFVTYNEDTDRYDTFGGAFDGTVEYRYVHLDGYEAGPKDTSREGPGEVLDLEFAPGSDADLYTNMHLTIVQGATTLFDEAWAPGGDIEFYTRNFTNGTARLTLTCDDDFEGVTGKVLIDEDVAVYLGPTVEIGDYSYDPSTSTATVAVSITDDFNVWSGLTARLQRQTGSETGTQYKDSNERDFTKTQTTLTFPINSSADAAMLNVPLLLKLNPNEVYTSSETITLLYVELTGWNAEYVNPTSAPGESLTFTIAGDSSLYTDYQATVTQENVSEPLFNGSITLSPDTREGMFISTLAFTYPYFGNGTASLTVTCLDGISGQRITLIDGEDVDVYGGPSLDDVEASYNASQRRADVTVSVTDEYHQWDNVQGRLIDYSTVTQITSRNTVGDSNVLMFTVDNDALLNRNLTFELGTWSDDAEPQWTVASRWGTVRLSYAALADYQAEPMDLSQSDDPGELLTLTIDGDPSLLTSYHARITQGNESVTVLFDDDIALTGTDPIFTSSIIFTELPENGEAYLTLTCMDGSTGSSRTLLEGVTIPVESVSVTGISATYDYVNQIGRVEFTISDPQNTWSNLTVKMLDAGGKVQYLDSVTGTISNTATFAEFEVSLNSAFLNEELYLTFFMAGDEKYRSTETVHFAFAKVERFDSEVLEQALYPNNKGIIGTVVATDLNGDLDDFEVTITRNNGQIVLYSSVESGDDIQPGVPCEMRITTAFTNGVANVNITWFNNVTQQIEMKSTTVDLYNEYELTINSAKGYIDSTTGAVTGTVSYSTVNYGQALTLSVQTRSGWQESSALVNVGNGTVTFDLGDVANLNTDLAFRLYAAVDGLQWEDTVNFVYPTVSVADMDTLDPAGGTRGIQFTFAESDPDNRWSNYHAKLLGSDDITVLKEQDLANTGHIEIRIDGEYSNSNGTLIITCTADGVSDTEVYRGSVYYGPTVTFGSPLEIGEGGTAGTNDFVQYALFDEFGSEGDDLTVVVLLDDYDESECPEGYGYVGNTHLEFNVDGYTIPLGEELPVIVYAISPEDYTRTEVTRGTIVFVDEIQD